MDPSTFTVKRLFRDCLRLADYISTQGGDRATLRRTVRAQFKQNAGLTDEKEIEAAKAAAVRGLSNYMFHEAQRLATQQQTTTAAAGADDTK